MTTPLATDRAPHMGVQGAEAAKDPKPGWGPLPGYPTISTDPSRRAQPSRIAPHTYPHTLGHAPPHPFSKGRGQLAQSLLAKTLSHTIPVIRNPPRSCLLPYPSFATHQRVVPSHTPDKIDRNRPRPHTVASAPSSAAPSSLPTWPHRPSGSHALPHIGKHGLTQAHITAAGPCTTSGPPHRSGPCDRMTPSCLN